MQVSRCWSECMKSLLFCFSSTLSFSWTKSRSSSPPSSSSAPSSSLRSWGTRSWEGTMSTLSSNPNHPSKMILEICLALLIFYSVVSQFLHLFSQTYQFGLRHVSEYPALLDEERARSLLQNAGNLSNASAIISETWTGTPIWGRNKALRMNGRDEWKTKGGRWRVYYTMEHLKLDRID